MMDIIDLGPGDVENSKIEEEGLEPPRHRPMELPADLPRSLNDRRMAPTFTPETEMFDAWNGESQFLTTPLPAKHLEFKLSLGFSEGEDVDHHGDLGLRTEIDDSRLMEMRAARAAHREERLVIEDVDDIATDSKLSERERRETLQKCLNMAASNGDVERIQKLVGGKAKSLVDVNAPDDEGTAPLIYASCFGHQDVVAALIDAGAQVDKQDRNQWSALMWAMTNRHKAIAKLLLDHGASPEVRSSSGRTAFDFVAPNSEISDYLHESGYVIGNAGVVDDFYSTGFSQDKFEEEMAENEMKRRMMMESAINLEVDLSSLGLDEQPESPEELESEGQDFIWDRCLNDQMFVFQESELSRILNIIITNMTPQRSPTQKPVPANILFLSARYAHYHSSPELLATLLISAMDKIDEVVERHQWDMTILAFWISNATLLLHYLKKDGGLVTATAHFQLQLAELINEIFILIIRDAERRMDKVLDAAMLDHETISGFEDVHFQNEWRIFRSSKSRSKPPEAISNNEKRFRPPSPKRRAQTSPRNIASLLSSTLFVLDLYDIHSVIISQTLSQLLYWLGAELFNRIMSNRKYLARTKAMQIRMNLSTLEDWARSNNRQPEHYENGSTSSSGENTVDAARRHLAPVIQLLQWLQCFSSLGEESESLVGTIQQLPRLSPQHLMHAATHYRPEVGERGLSRSAMRYLINLRKENDLRRERQRQSRKSVDQPRSGATSPSSPASSIVSSPKKAPWPAEGIERKEEEEQPPEHLLLDPALMLPFTLPTSTDLLVSFGAGFGGLNRERERRYIPTVPAEFLSRLDAGGSGATGYDE